MLLKEESSKLDEDGLPGGFFVLCCNKYDDKLSLMHTQNTDINIKFNKRIEPGTL